MIPILEVSLGVNSSAPELAMFTLSSLFFTWFCSNMLYICIHVQDGWRSVDTVFSMDGVAQENIYMVVRTIMSPCVHLGTTVRLGRMQSLSVSTLVTQEHLFFCWSHEMRHPKE